MGWGGGKGHHGHHHHHHHGHRGPGLLGIAAEAAVVGGVTAAVVGAASASRRPPPRAYQPAPVVVMQPQPVPAYSQAAPVYVQQGQPVQAMPVVQVGVPVAMPVGKGRGKGKGKTVFVPQQQPLGAMRISLPASCMEARDGTTYFAVVVTPEQGEPWKVMRRYKEFDALHTRLGPMSGRFPGAPFPGKTFLGAACTGQKLEDRRQGLETWLQRATEDPVARGTWLRPLRDFLENGRVFFQAAPVAAAPPPPAAFAAPPPVSAPSAPPMEAAPPMEDEGLTLQIVVPDGVGPGGQLGVEVPDVGQVIFVVPEGAAPGAQIQLWYDRSSSTLTPLA